MIDLNKYNPFEKNEFWKKFSESQKELNLIKRLNSLKKLLTEIEKYKKDNSPFFDKEPDLYFDKSKDIEYLRKDSILLDFKALEKKINEFIDILEEHKPYIKKSYFDNVEEINNRVNDFFDNDNKKEYWNTIMSDLMYNKYKSLEKSEYETQKNKIDSELKKELNQNIENYTSDNNQKYEYFFRIFLILKYKELNLEKYFPETYKFIKKGIKQKPLLKQPDHENKTQSFKIKYKYSNLLNNLYHKLEPNFIDSEYNDFKKVFDGKKGLINWIGDGAKKELVYFYFLLFKYGILESERNKHSIVKQNFTLNGNQIAKGDNELKTFYSNYNKSKDYPKRSKEIKKIIKDLFLIK